jgi:proteic killer suppression protein
MLELSTTATFDRLFSKLPKSVQRKAATKSDFFRENPFILHSILKSFTRSS